MLAKFGNGPYDGVALHLSEATPTVILPLSVRTTLKMCDRTISAECKYRLVTVNDYEAQYQFEAVRM